jgi:DNA-binding MarR family transcriptional regulator
MHATVLALETAGLLERRTVNRRVVLVRPTKRGLATLQAATRRVRAVEKAALAGLSRNDRQAVRKWLASLAATESTTTTEAGPLQKERVGS